MSTKFNKFTNLNLAVLSSPSLYRVARHWPISAFGQGPTSCLPMTDFHLIAAAVSGTAVVTRLKGRALLRSLSRLAVEPSTQESEAALNATWVTEEVAYLQADCDSTVASN